MTDDRKKAIEMLLDDGHEAVKNGDDVAFHKVSDCLIYLDQYQELSDKLYELYNIKGSCLITHLQCKLVELDDLVKLGFPYAEQLYDIVNDSINYFAELDNR